jgi:hypothetical protein
MDRVLPSCLGFGDLDRASVRDNKGVIEANYTFQGDLVHTVRWSDGHCQLDDHWQGRLVSMTSAPDLKQALVRDFSAVDGRNDPRFAALCERAVRTGNVHFRVPQPRETRLVYYPAGLLFLLRLPLPQADATRLGLVRAALRENGADAAINPLGEQSGLILRLRADGGVIEEAVTLVDATARIGTVSEASGLLASSGAIRREKRFRLMVVEASEAGPEHVRVFPGFEPSNADHDVAFMVLGADAPVTVEWARDFLKANGPRVAAGAVSV